MFGQLQYIIVNYKVSLTTKQMSILQGVKAVSQKFSNNKFIIKSKPSVKQTTKPIHVEQNIFADEQDVLQFLTYMVERSKRFQELVAVNNILNQEEFCEKQLFQSKCLKTVLKCVLDKMLNERRLGKNLKGMNKSNLIQIENEVWTCLQRQAAIYQNQKKYIYERQKLKEQLSTRKQSILRQIQNVSLKFIQKDKTKAENQQTQLVIQA